ncbi:MAG: phage terminase large subunit [Alphaproteobacteria bacterium]|nr:phage terminase large subunit [Alphaproteobacteria bacterium]
MRDFDEELAAALDEKTRKHFRHFIGRTLLTADPDAHFQKNWHIDLIAEHLEAARLGKLTRLIINMPPRALKSQCVSIAWPAWILGHDPSARIMAASYSAQLAIRHSLDCRQVVTSAWYQRLFPDTRIARDQNEKHKFMTTRRGFRFATSVGGTATGEGGNFLIIDDPMNPSQAMSAAARAQVKRWYDHTFSTRLNDKKRGVIVLVMQRLHMDDLTAHLLEKGGFTLLSLPAIATGTDYFHFGSVTKNRGEKEALHPAREDTALIERAKIELGAQAFSAQYQQQPLPEEGGMLKRPWLRRHNIPSPLEGEGRVGGGEERHHERIVQSWDTAIKAENHHDASVCLTFVESGNVAHLIDARVERLEYPELKRRVRELAEKFKPHAILVEDKASGQQLLQDLKRETSLPLVAVQSSANKVTRFAAVSAMIEAGRLSLPHNAPWLAAFEQEILEFPHGKHDDQVDALTQYLDFLRKSSFDRLSMRRI